MSALVVLALALVGAEPERPNESDMFGSDEPAAIDAGAPTLSGSLMAATDAGTRDNAELSDNGTKSKFDTDEVKADPIKIGANLLMTAQVFARENIKFRDQSFSAPFILDTFIDGRPNDRLRAFAQARLQYDPTRPIAAASSAPSTASTGSLGLTSTGAVNPNVQLDQLWLRFDVARKLFLTIGRQKVRWGTARIWFPTDFLNSQPRDPLNPFDARLGVNMVKVHLPIESLGWNFYAYGILDNIEAGATGLTIGRLAGALRGEFVLGPAEIGIGGIWQAGRRPRYALDVSTPIGPIDVYGEVAFRDARDFLRYQIPDDTTFDNFALKANHFVNQFTFIEQYRPEGFTAQATGGVSWQFNYTDKNTLILGAEYFYNPMGYANPLEYAVQTLGQTLNPNFDQGAGDPIQKTPLYQGKHHLALTVAAPGLPELSWVTASLSTIVNFNDPSGLTRLDLSFRVLTYLTVQVFGSAFYGQTGGELRFALPVEQLASQASQAGRVLGAPKDVQDSAAEQTRQQLKGTDKAPLFQAGVLLRLSI